MVSRHILFLLVWWFISTPSIAQDGKSSPQHYVCIQSLGMYHDKSGCASLQMCSGGKVRKTRNVEGLKPCPKCAKAVNHNVGNFTDIKNVLGVKDKKQIADSLGTSESLVSRPGGITLRISGPPESRTVNMIEFFLKEPVRFDSDTLFSPAFYQRLGLRFNGCKADTIQSTVPHPVTGKVKKDVTIEYRGCSVVEPRDQYEDTSKYFYELTFIAKESDAATYLDKVQLFLKVDRP